MSDNPLTPVFDAQRTALEQSQNLTHDAIDAQRASFNAMADTIKASESIVEQNAELTKGTINAYFDAIETSTPNGSIDLEELRTLVDEGIESATETQLQSIETLIEAINESSKAYDELAESYTEVVDSSFDVYLDAHERVETNVATVAESVEEATEEFDVSA